jgi:hypothetical protein
MMTELKYSLAVSSIYLWIGFVCAISFMEAWLKFKAPGVTMPIGLGIGRLVFSALNKVEWIFAIAIIVNLLLSKEEVFTQRNFAFLLPLLVLGIQTLFLLPALDRRAELYIQRQPTPPSNLHMYYIGVEAIKVISLFIFSIRLFR